MAWIVKQRAVLDPAMQGRDLIGRAKTGTGKTLAFGIPIIHNIIKSFEADRTLRCLRVPSSFIIGIGKLRAEVKMSW